MICKNNRISDGGGQAEPPHPHPCPPRMRISLLRHDHLGEERWPISQEKGQELVPQWALTGFNLHRNTGKARQSLSGSKDQTIDNIQRTLEGLF